MKYDKNLLFGNADVPIFRRLSRKLSDNELFQKDWVLGCCKDIRELISLVAVTLLFIYLNRLTARPKYEVYRINL